MQQLRAQFSQRSSDPGKKEVNEAYYGTVEVNNLNSPLELWLKKGVISIPSLSIIASVDEQSIIKSVADFKKGHEKKGGRYHEIIVEGHNHVSTIAALNSTEIEGSKWGDDAAQWMLRQLEV